MKKTIFFLSLLVSTLAAGPYHPAIDYIFPLPESTYLTPKTTIILKLDEKYNDQITDLSNLIQVYTNGGELPGKTFFAADERTIIFKPARKFDRGEFIDVFINTGQFYSTDFDFYFQTAFNTPHTIDGLKKPAKPQKVTQAGEVKNTPPRVINGVAVPSDFPRIETHQYGETAPGMIFFATNYPKEGTGNYLIICKNDGTPYFYRRYDDVVRSGNLTVHPTGVLTAHFYHKWFYVVLDRNFVEIDTIRAGHGYETDNHELQILKNGHALLIGRDRIPVDMSALVEGGQKNATVEGHHFQELDENKNVIFEWRSWDHYNIKDSYVNLKSGFIDFVHMNSIAIDYDGHYVISARDLNEITKINRQTGEIIWRLNGRHNQFTFLNDPEEFIYQHDFRPVPGKPHHYTVFDNGRGRRPEYSRAVEYKIDPDKKTIEKVWQYRHEPDWFTPSMGSAQRLANGNTFVDFPRGKLKAVEVSPDGDVLFEIFSTGHANYRCRRFDWTAEMKYPYLIAENLGAKIRLIFNKFGDDNVDHYDIYYGTNRNPAELLTSTKETYVDIDATQLESNTLYYFRVKAVDNNGEESVFSKTVSGSIKYLGPGQNAVKNSSFNVKNYWDLKLRNGAIATGEYDESQYKISVIKGGESMADIQLYQENISLLQGKDYLFEFDAYANSKRAINAKVESVSSPHINYGKIGNTALGTRLTHYKFPFHMSHPTNLDARVVFNGGGDKGQIYIDNVSLTYAATQVGDEFVNINFQPPDVSGPTDYRTDNGDPFGDRGNGYSYGWLDGNNSETRFRNGFDDLRYATLNHMQKNDKSRIWELDIPNGTYHIFLVMGDASYTDQINHIQIENSVLRDQDGEDHFDEYTVSVNVNDGRLTLRPGPEASNAKVCFIDISKAASQIDCDERTKNTPESCVLHQNYPNPFNSETSLEFTLPQNDFVNVSVYDIRGRKVKTLLNKNMSLGEHSLSFDASFLPSGLYLYILETSFTTRIRKMIVIK